MPEEKKLTELESLELITSMINTAKNSYIESGVGPLFWGVLITFCSLANYAQVQYHFYIGFDVWLLSLFGLVPQIFYAWRSSKRVKFKSREESTINFIWVTFAICIFMLSFHGQKVNAPHEMALYMMVYGIPTFITGGVRKFLPMIIGGIICWICSIASYYTGFANNLLLMAVCSISAWLIPGIILRRRYLKLKHV